MNNTAYIVVFALIVVLPWLAVYLYLKFISKNILKNYKLLSEKYGLLLDTSKKAGLTRHPSADGVYRDLPVSIGCFMRGSGRRKYASTFVKTECLNPYGLSFFIIKRTKLNNVLYGREGIETGDSEFSEKFIVSADNPEVMNSLLNFSIKNKLLQIQNLGFKGELKLEYNSLQYVEPELIYRDVNLLRIELMLHLLCEFADELSQKHKPLIQNT